MYIKANTRDNCCAQVLSSLAETQSSPGAFEAFRFLNLRQISLSVTEKLKLSFPLPRQSRRLFISVVKLPHGFVHGDHDLVL